MHTQKLEIIFYLLIYNNLMLNYFCASSYCLYVVYLLLILDRTQCFTADTKALNKTHFSSSPKYLKGGGDITFVTVFTTYNTTVDSLVKSRSSEQVSVGNMSYNKVERSMAVLNAFINFIEVII